jgi:transposase-like protein
MNKNELNRVVAWRLKLLRQADEMPRGVAQTCRHFGLSRKTFYKWKARYKSHGEAGLCDRPRVPQRFAKATPREVVSESCICVIDIVLDPVELRLLEACMASPFILAQRHSVQLVHA